MVLNDLLTLVHALKSLTFQFTPVTHMVYLEIRLHYLDFAIENLTSSNWISKYTMCVTGVNWKVTFLSACSNLFSSSPKKQSKRIIETEPTRWLQSKDP